MDVSATLHSGEPQSNRRKLLDPSELGTKEYWDQAYKHELQNNEEDAEDEGTVWFSESGAEEAILTQLNALELEGSLDREHARFLDLGTGNGHLLFSLREEDDEEACWSGEMVGVDYSETSVELSRRIAAQKEVDDAVQFELWDLLSAPPGDWLKEGFDVALDKGTFDAISLMPRPSDSETAHPCEIYREKVAPLIKAGVGFLVITSCNWTKEEVHDWLAPAGAELEYYAEAKYPTFTFGGQTGQSIVTLVLKRRSVR